MLPISTILGSADFLGGNTSTNGHSKILLTLKLQLLPGHLGSLLAGTIGSFYIVSGN